MGSSCGVENAADLCFKDRHAEVESEACTTPGSRRSCGSRGHAHSSRHRSRPGNVHVRQVVGGGGGVGGVHRDVMSRQSTSSCRSSSQAEEELAASLQAEAWGDCSDAVVYLQQEHAMQSCRTCRRRVTVDKGAQAQRLKEPLSRPPAEPLPCVEEVTSAEARLRWALSDYGLRAREIIGDGACQFRAVADQLFGDQELHWKVRGCAVEHLRAHAAEYAGFAVAESFDEYLLRMAEPTTWGDNLSLQALADAYCIQVCILSSFLNRRFLCVYPGEGLRPTHEVWLGFFAEYHYTSLEPVDEPWSFFR